jgi:hypothetical protein
VEGSDEQVLGSIPILDSLMTLPSSIENTPPRRLLFDSTGIQVMLGKGSWVSAWLVRSRGGVEGESDSHLTVPRNLTKRTKEEPWIAYITDEMERVGEGIEPYSR